MSTDRRSEEYELGVENFINFAISHTNDPNCMRCPCIACGNLKRSNAMNIKAHLFFNGIDQSYRLWIWHGEELLNNTSTSSTYNFQNSCSDTNIDDPTELVRAAVDESSQNHTEWVKLLEEAEKPLYPGCAKYTKLSGLVKLYNIKGKYGWSDQSFTELLKLLHDMLPASNELPVSVYDVRKTLNSLGCKYEKIHACPNDCILYRKEYHDATSCPTCGVSRWKASTNIAKPKTGIPAKVLWYFPPIPRFKRMFRNKENSKNLTWHASERTIDGLLRHPADSTDWKLVDHLWPDFASESRNLRLALAADGINPYGSQSSTYSCWPVMLVTYNLPPWLCMKRKFIMLTLLISGPKQPGNDIDIYLQPLIDDLKLLWEKGVEVYDGYRNETFKLRAVLLWTINDFPAYGNLSGHTVKGYKACPICSEQTYSERLTHCKKNNYMGHRRFLSRYHPYRKQKKAFNLLSEDRMAPEPLTGDEILKRMEEISFSWGKAKKQSDAGGIKIWKKKSIFFQLEYWKSLHVRHIIDVMHDEKNICESIIGTLLDIPGKTKDGLAARLDLATKNLRLELAPKVGEKKTYLPPACYTLSREEKRKVCKILSEIKVPDGYCSNFRNIISLQDLKLKGLKSHDYHALMQQLLPVAIRSVLPKHVRYAIIRFCFFFNSLCKKVVDTSTLKGIQDDLVVTLCMFEKYFPPSFFDIMVHLTVHLIREVQLCGPVYLRWMYPFERYMKILKSYVRNRNRPEGCIAECYIAEEAIEFCSEYLSGVNTVGLPSRRNSEEGSTRGTVVTVDPIHLEQAHRYVLQNTHDVQPYIK